MTTVEIMLSVAMGIMTIWFLVNKGRVSAEQELTTNRINALADETKRYMETMRGEITYIAKNAQGIASNALSSAQRAESKILKISETVKTEVENA